MNRFTSLVAVALTAVVAGSALAQHGEKAAAMPQAAYFKKVAGTWDATVHEGTTTSKGVETVRIIGDGMWAITDFEGSMMDSPYRGHGIYGYDLAKKMHTGVWVDTMSPVPMHTEGNFDATGKVLTCKGTMPSPENPAVTMNFTLVETWVDDNNRTFSIAMQGPDGKSMEMMKIDYKRRK